MQPIETVQQTEQVKDYSLYFLDNLQDATVCVGDLYRMVNPPVEVSSLDKNVYRLREIGVQADGIAVRIPEGSGTWSVRNQQTNHTKLYTVNKDSGYLCILNKNTIENSDLDEQREKWPILTAFVENFSGNIQVLCNNEDGTHTINFRGVDGKLWYQGGEVLI